MKKLYMILPLALILCFMVGCQDKEAMAVLEQFKAQAAVEEQNKEIVLRQIEGLNRGSTDVLQEVYAPNLAFYYPSRSAPRSKEEAIELLKIYLRAFPDFNWDIQDMIAKGDEVIVRSIITGTHKEDLLGIPAAGTKVGMGQIIICRLKDGKIIEEWAEYEMLNMMEQLGMELKPKEEK